MAHHDEARGPAADTVADLDRRHLWHPFTQQLDWCREEALVIERGEGTDLIDSTACRRCGATSTATATR